MKKVFRTVALCIMMGVAAAGCQKEDQMLKPICPVTDNVEVRTMYYSVGGKTMQIVLRSEAEWADFLNRMLALAESGDTVSFSRMDQVDKPVFTKEVCTFVTSDHDEAYAWAAKMTDGGYQVTISFNEKDGTYTCIAVN